MKAVEAKELCLDVWEYLAGHPEIEHKSDLPRDLWVRIVHLNSRCPLCEYFRSQCSRCPLRSCSENVNTAWRRWNNYSLPKVKRMNAAMEIVKKVRSWDAEALDSKA